MMGIFNKEKSDFLKKKDKSKKGCVDKDIKEIINIINSRKDYYTTSSCAGGVVLLEMKSKRKNESNWLFVKHNKIKFNEIKNSLSQYNKNNKKILELPLKAGNKEETSFESCAKNQVWLKQEPLILHVRCRDLKSAKKLLDASRKIFKRAGIISLNDKKIVVEIIGSEKIDAIIADGDFAADEKYLKNLIKYANRNFEENKRKGEMFLKIIKNI